MNNSLLPISYQSHLMLALEEILRHGESLPIEDLKNFWNPLKCREDLLPYLASYLGTTQWDSDVPIAQKRIGCLNALNVNKHRGTLGALKLALKSLNLNATVIEWWQVNPSRGSTVKKGWADIVLQENEIIYSEEIYKRIYKLIDEVKRLSLHITIKKQSPIKDMYYIGGSSNTVVKATIKWIAEKSKQIKINKTIRAAAIMQESRRVTIW